MSIIAQVIVVNQGKTQCVLVIRYAETTNERLHQQSSPYIDPLGSLGTQLNPLTPES